MEVFCNEKNFIYYPRINDDIRYVIDHHRRLTNTSGEKLVKIDNMQPVYGQTITASANLSDDSMGKNLTFQWQVQESRISDKYINVKSGGTSNSYTVTLNDIGKKLRVVVGLKSNGESKTSLPTNAVLNANPLIASIKFDNNLKDDANQENC